MTATAPHVDLSRFKIIEPRTIALAYLRSSRGSLTEKLLTRRLAGFLTAERLLTALSGLRNEGLLTSAPELKLSDAGRAAADRDFGRDAGKPWELIRSRSLPLLVLGLYPDAVTSTSIEPLRAYAIAVGFGLAEPNKFTTKTSAGGALVWQVLKGSMPQVVGRGPFPSIDRLGAVEQFLLAKLANSQAKGADRIFEALAAAAIQIRETDADSFRTGLIKVGLRTNPPLESDADFAARVKSVAENLSTPPFRGRVSISQVYDVYGRAHADAGSLAAFKARLVRAAQVRSLELGRLELPEQMDSEQRTRSEARWGEDTLHFVITARKY